MSKVGKEQISLWKETHGKVYEIEVGGCYCYLKAPTRQILSLSMSYESNDPLKSDEVHC